MNKTSLYIHIPFCAQKCLYCDFASYAGKEFLKDEYIKSLCIELKNRANENVIETIFIGGGTPSILEVSQMETLFKAINELNLSKDLEFTVECNPGSLNKEKLLTMNKYGVNRLSLGLQAVQEDILKIIGRIHNFKEFKENFSLARECGFENINVDLMFGLPNQTLSMWQETLKDIIKLNPEHISAYSLIIEEGTPFYKFYEDDKLKLPNEDEEREMYYKAKELLEEAGFYQYEISNYSKENKECRHNVVYWDLKEWIGIGSSAASFIDGRRIKNTDSVEEYIKSIKLNNNVTCESIENSKEDNMEEFMFMGLRKIYGISEKDFKARFRVSIDEVYGDVISKYSKNNLIIREDGRICLSDKGIELSNQIMADFLL